MSSAIIGLATDLQPLPDSWKPAERHFRGHQPAENPGERAQFLHRETNTLSASLLLVSASTAPKRDHDIARPAHAGDDPLDMGFSSTNVLKLSIGWAGVAWAPPIRSRNRYRDDTQRIGQSQPAAALLALLVPLSHERRLRRAEN